MTQTNDINRPIIEDLYCEALVLADEVRLVFDLNPVRDTGEDAELTRLALSVEGLRTTTRVMHVLAWLLNYRAFFAGDLNKTQLRRHSRLPADRIPETANLIRLKEPIRALIDESVQLHGRISRLDTAWRSWEKSERMPVQDLQAELGRMIALER
ncbi:MAG: DUF1465 family protein [Pontixanthobacter sp.]